LLSFGGNVTGLWYTGGRSEQDPVVSVLGIVCAQFNTSDL